MGDDLRHMSGREALHLALARSGLTQDALARKLGMGEANVGAWFARDDYYPSLVRIPLVCRALGNRVLLDWLDVQLEELDEAPHIGCGARLLREVGKLGVEFGHVSQAVDQALEDGKITAAEARTICAELDELAGKAKGILSGLDHLSSSTLPVAFMHGEGKP